jgi:hypothetical protein
VYFGGAAIMSSFRLPNSLVNDLDRPSGYLTRHVLSSTVDLMPRLTERVYLVIGADRSVRVSRATQHRLSIRPDQIAIPIDLTYPERWGRVLDAEPLSIIVPDFVPDIDVQVAPADLPEQRRPA